MGYTEERKNLQDWFKQNWTSTPIYFDNDIVEETSGYYVRFYILNGESKIAGLGGDANIYRFPGVIAIQIFGPEEEGTGVFDIYADTLISLLMAKRFAGITRRGVPYKRNIGAKDGLYQVNVLLPFSRDEIL